MAREALSKYGFYENQLQGYQVINKHSCGYPDLHH